MTKALSKILSLVEEMIIGTKDFNLNFLLNQKTLCKDLLEIVKSEEFSQKTEILEHKDDTFESVVHYLNEYVELSGN